MKFKEEESGWLSAEFRFPSKVVSGAAVYIWSSVRKEFKRALLVHELAEFFYMYEVFGEDLRMPALFKEEFLKQEATKAHNLAKRFDDIYAREYFDVQTYSEYNEFKKQMK